MKSKFDEAIKNAYKVFLNVEAQEEEGNTPPDAANNSSEEQAPEGEYTAKKVADTIDAASLSMREMFVDFISMIIEEKLAGKLEIKSPEFSKLIEGIQSQFTKDNPLQSLDKIQELIKQANDRYKPSL